MEEWTHGAKLQVSKNGFGLKYEDLEWLLCAGRPVLQAVHIADSPLNKETMVHARFQLNKSFSEALIAPVVGLLSMRNETSIVSVPV